MTALVKALALGFTGLAICLIDPAPVMAVWVTVGIAVIASWSSLRRWL